MRISPTWLLFCLVFFAAGSESEQDARPDADTILHNGKVRSEIGEPYGVDEFMYFLEGGVTLTSSDGTVQEINAGEAVTIPREWMGVWDTDGYTKIWVIYSEDGSGLE